LLKEFKSYKNKFFKDKISQLLTFKKDSYIIELKGKNLFYRFIYNLFKLKLKELY